MSSNDDTTGNSTARTLHFPRAHTCMVSGAPLPVLALEAALHPRLHPWQVMVPNCTLCLSQRQNLDFQDLPAMPKKPCTVTKPHILFFINFIEVTG